MEKIMYENLPVINDIRRVSRLVNGNLASKFLECLRTAGLHAMIVYRFGKWTSRQKILLRIIFNPVYFILNTVIKVAWGIEIPRAAIIGPGNYIGHFGGIIISPKAKIGSGCSISHGVTIGISGHGANRGVPTIGDNVYIGPGAKLIGPINIGNRVNIGPNVVIHQDIPDDSVVVLDPGFKIISRIKHENI
jgi:serine O-acetyltransferase